MEPYQDIAAEPMAPPESEFDPDFDASEQQTVRSRRLVHNMRRVACQISLNQEDGLEL